MLTKYIKAAMHRARYEILPDDGSFYGEIGDLPGVFANAETLETCRDLLQEVPEGWLILSIADHDLLPAMSHATVSVSTPA